MGINCYWLLTWCLILERGRQVCTRYIVVYRGLYSIPSQSLHGGDSSECLESTKQPSLTEKAVERFCIMSCKVAVHVILSYPSWSTCTPAGSHASLHVTVTSHDNVHRVNTLASGVPCNWECNKLSCIAWSHSSVATLVDVKIGGQLDCGNTCSVETVRMCICSFTPDTLYSAHL